MGASVWINAQRRTSLYTTDAGSTLVSPSGDAVGRAEDLTGNGHHAKQSSAADRPTYSPTALGGRPCFTLDGAGDVLSTDAVTLTTATLFFVGAKASGLGTYGAYVKLSATASDAASTDGRVLYDGIGAGTSHFMANPSTSVYQELVTNVAESAGTLTYWCWGWGSTRASWFLRRAGVAATQGAQAVGTAVAPSANPLHICRGYSNVQGVIRVGEVIAFPRVLSAAEIAVVERYIRGEWGL